MTRLLALALSMALILTAACSSKKCEEDNCDGDTCTTNEQCGGVTGEPLGPGDHYCSDNKCYTIPGG